MRIVIVGGGFGGLRLARALNNHPEYSITLIDCQNHHQFQPLFYQVATASIDASNICFPLRKIFQNSRNVRIRLDELQSVDCAGKKVITVRDEYPYDTLVVATGATSNFFGNSDFERFAHPLKSSSEALKLRYALLQNFEDALHCSDPVECQRLMNIVVVGGGPTGVELSGAIAEMRKYVLPKEYQELDFGKMNVYLVEGLPRILGAMDPVSSARSMRYLDKLGVKVLPQTMLKGYDGRTVSFADGSTLPTCFVIWAAGIKGNVPKGIDPSVVSRGNRITVDEFNRVGGRDDVFAIGDVACQIDELFPKGHPQVAPVAIQQADRLADNLERIRKGKSPKPFVYRDKGSMATIGRNLAVVDLPKPRLNIGGLPAWLIWMFLHLVLILGVKNQLFVFVNWVYTYLTNDQHLRLIFRDLPRGGQERR